MSNEIIWYQNKIKGGLAEEVCRSHFQYLGFDIANTGIEHIAPEYTKYSNRIEAKDNEVKKVLNKNPDLLVSKDDKALLVEVKYSSTIKNDEDFYNYAENLLFTYRYMLFKCSELGEMKDNQKDEFMFLLKNLKDNEIRERICDNFIFYVVLQNKDEHFNSYVHIFFPKNYKTNGHGLGWRNAKNKAVNNALNIENFNKGYLEVVEPILNELFNL